MGQWNAGGFGDGGWGDDDPVPSPPAGTGEYVPAGIDHVALGLSRVIQQYRAAGNLLAVLTFLLGVSNEQEAALQQLLQLADIDAMTGVNLDVLGRIVGVTRYVDQALSLPFFGFQGYTDQLPFGELGLNQFGARFYELGEPDSATSVLNDPEFRLLIKAKIAKNASHGYPEEVLAALTFLFGTPVVNVEDPGGMYFNVAIGRTLTATEQQLVVGLDILPRPAGVRIGTIVTFNAGQNFGFADTPGALTFGELGSPNVGGTFAEAIQV